MPATFEAFGIKFMYPENWTPAARDDEEGDGGVTLDMPSGGFFSIEQDYEGSLPEEIFEEVADTISAEFGEVERQPVDLNDAMSDERAIDFRFYCLDLLVVSRVVLMTVANTSLVIQIQAEMRDFETNEKVFEAILMQLRQC